MIFAHDSDDGVDDEDNDTLWALPVLRPVDNIKTGQEGDKDQPVSTLSTLTHYVLM